MKILIVTPTYYPDVNGASYFTQRLAQYLHRKGHDILVIAPSRHIHNENIVVDDVKIFGIRSIPTFINGLRIAQGIFIKNVLKKKIKEFAPDIIHLQSHLLFSKTVIKIAKGLNIPVVGTNHFMPENIVHYLHLPKKLEKFVIKKAWNDFIEVFKHLKAVTTPTQIGAKLLTDVGLEKNIIAISCGIDMKIFKPNNNGDYLKERYKLPNKPISLYLGRLDKEKNVNLLLKGFADSRKKVDSHFVIAGFGAEENNLKKLVKDLNIVKHVTFTGFISNDDKPNLYKVADLFLIAGIAELQSIVTMEAMATGLPVIGVNAMALPHLIKHNENGFLFELESAISDISKYITHMFTDRGSRDKKSAASLEIIQKHDINKSIEAYEKLYNEAIKN